MSKSDYLVYFYFDDGSESYEFVNSFNRAVCSAFEFPPNNAVRSEIYGPDGKTWSYRLKGI